MEIILNGGLWVELGSEDQVQVLGQMVKDVGVLPSLIWNLVTSRYWWPNESCWAHVLGYIYGKQICF